MEISAPRFRIANLVILLIIAFMCNGCDKGKLKVTIENRGTKPLQSVVLKVTGNSYDLGDIAPSKSKAIGIEVTGESHLEIQQSSGKQFVVDVYIEPGYGGSIHVVVTRDTVISIKNKIDMIDLTIF